MTALSFQRLMMRPWKGRYARIPGDTAVLHIVRLGGQLRVAILWNINEDRGKCVAVDSQAVRSLVEAVSNAKQKMGGGQGGSFQINEFGQVLVPASTGGRRRMFVGELHGDLPFEDPFNNRTFTLGDDSRMSTGDNWPLPYVGMPFNLSGRSKVYFWREDDEGGRSEYLQREDRGLVQAMRAVRRSGAMRFIVNPAGVVLTKRPPRGEWRGPNETWEPVYIGRLNLRAWFDKEE